MATLAPSAASRFAIAAPMPREPPVTSATFPTKFDMQAPLLSLDDLALTREMPGPRTPIPRATPPGRGTFGRIEDMPDWNALERKCPPPAELNIAPPNGGWGSPAN